MLTKEQIADTYFGFMEDSGNLVKYKARKALDKVYRCGEELMDRKQIVFTRLQLGYRPMMRERPKVSFTLEKEEFSVEHNCDYTSTFKTTKTEYDYAKHLIAMGLLVDEAALQYIQAERDEIKRKELEALEAERLEQEQRDNEKAEFECFRKWLESEAKNYSDTEKIELQRKIYLDVLGSCNPNMINLLVLIDNIDKPLCKEALKGMLRPDNTASRSTFKHITGVSLGKTKREMESIIDGISMSDCTGVKDYKPRKSNNKLELFYFHHRDGTFIEIMAEPLNVSDFDFFIQESKSNCSISEARTGIVLVRGDTRDDALTNLNSLIDREGVQGLNEIISKKIEEFGLSPRYKRE